ncbi:VWA domain-containing protein [Curvibacter sp. CHRR-16]|uniref:vWA domain-containing protein n=1 Tax=Curvibacter sp. CHRR-16 TaxID=2835872 RepID=UPI001BD9DFAE|nr:VWA domain-containing protein [Curvibacter sp. CHRR-16]MBT0571759.1 VWA domain-containing protein [Curvibacter sp. CHRR-16]
MLLDFFYALRHAGLPVSTPEYLTLLQALQRGVAGPQKTMQKMAAELDGQAAAATKTIAKNTSVAGDEVDDYGLSLDDFYYLARLILIKDEKHYDKFNRAFGAFFYGLESLPDLQRALPEEWLRKNLEKVLSPEERAQLQALGWDELMKTLAERLREQQERHEGGNKWIGTGGTSPFGAYGHNPAGVRIGQDKGRNRTAVKVWDQRTYADYDENSALTSRQMQLALRRLRQFARQGAATELDLPQTIERTAANAGWLDIHMVPERHNQVKVLLLMDVGGTMDEHVHRVAELFSAAKTAFKHLEFFYFHNCVYDYVWKHNQRRHSERTSTWDVLHKYNRDYKLIFVGDATMSPYEILQAGGSVEYMNEEPGAAWLQRLCEHFSHHVWINPEPQGVWQYRQSIALVQDLMQGRMYPLTLQGLEEAIRNL